VTKQGANTVTLSGANIYTGTTTINSGTLALGVNNALPTASNMILGGGTLATNSFSQTNALGTLALSSNSSIDMAILGGSILKFSDSHSTSWSGTLTINDWNGFFSGGGADELFFGSSESALSLSQLNEIVFTSPNGLSGNYEARILVTGEVVPGGILAPEPGTVALLVSGGLSLGGLALRRWRRRTISA
jgi:autotransporter-associated beta strand protein